MKGITIALFLSLLAVPATAQTTTGGSIRGYVKDQQGGVVPGATVTAAGDHVSQLFSAVTDADGYFRLLDLPPGEYTMTVELQGFARVVRPAVVVRAGMNVSVDFDLKVGDLETTVEVAAETPLIESRHAVQTVNISGDLQREIPINTRGHWSDFLSITPGVTGIQLPVGTTDTFYLRGSYFASHAIQIDGADMASAQQNDIGTVHLSREAIADVQVKTGAVDAASPLGVGAVINVATKSGTDVFKGSASTIYQAEGWNGTNQPGGTASDMDVFLPEVALGGPIARGRAWFFGSYRRERIRTGISRTPEQIALLRALRPSFNPFKSSLEGDHAFVKGSGQISPNHQVQVIYQRDPQNRRSAGATDAEIFLDQIFGGDVAIAARLSSIWGRSVTTRFGVSYNDKAQQFVARPDVPSRQVHATAFLSSGRLVGSGVIATLDNGNAGWTFHQPYSKSTLTGDLTYYHRGWIGSHEFQTGFYINPRDHQESVQRYANGGFSREQVVLIDPANPALGTRPFHREIFDVTENVNALSDSRDIAVYVQDAWRPTARLTVNAGVRIDAIRRVDKIFDVLVQRKTDVGPRVSANYMLTSDLKNSVRASWVRVHDVLPVNVQGAGSSTAGRRDLYDLDLDGTFETEFITPGTTAVTRNRIIDLTRGQPYIHEFIAGYTRQLPDRLAVDLSFIRRDYRDRTALVEVNGIYENSVFRGYRDEAFNEIFQLTANRWNWHVYNGLELLVTKQTRRVELLGSYTRSWRSLGGTWQPNDPASFIQPNAFPNTRGAGSVRDTTSNSLSGAAQTGDNQAWRDHVVRLGTVVHAPWKLVFATNLSAESGAYGGPVVTRLAAADPRFGPPTVQLSNGRVVSNPLATIIRFAYDTRGDQQNQLDTLVLWNLRAGREFTIGRHQLRAALDVFNVVNAGTDQAPAIAANQLFSPNFGLARFRQNPRAAQLSFRYSF